MTDGPYVSPLGDHNDNKRRYVRVANRRRDDLNEYWRDTIWQRTESESEMFLFYPYQKYIQSNNETILDQGTPTQDQPGR